MLAAAGRPGWGQRDRPCRGRGLENHRMTSASAPPPARPPRATLPADPAGEPPASQSVFQLAWPLMVSFVMRSLFNLVDTFFAATVGDAAVAAIGMTIPLEMAFVAVWVGSSNALTSLLGRSFGERAGERVEQLKRAGYALVAVLGPMFVGIGLAVWWLGPRLGLEPELGHNFGIYAGVLIGGTGLTGFWSIVPDSVVKAHHDTRSTMVAGILSNLANLALNTLFVFGFGWGISGIALSTVLGRLAGLSYALARARALERRRVAAWSGSAVPGRERRPLLRIAVLAVPSALGTLLVGTETAVANALLAQLPDEVAAVAAFGIYYRFVYLGLMPMIATSVALLPFVARHYGARNFGVIRRGLRQALGGGLAVVALVVAPLFWLGAEPIVQLLTEAERAHAYAVWALRFVPVACAAAYPFFVYRPLFEGIGRFVPGLVVAALRHVALAVPLALAGMRLAPAAGLSAFAGVLVGLAAAAALASLVFALWSRRLQLGDG
ncbi:MAG: MATE family efflux transporter [Planctomycetota bacterium]|nr:MAG: MATE family efflux transporter [Planctomycetota bacterium]